MTPPKRALFSLNLESQAESLYQRVEDLSKDTDQEGGVKVLESSGPTTGKTHLEYLTKPFERIVDSTIDGVVEGTGKKLDSVDGELETTHRSENTGRTAGSGEGHWTVTKKVQTRKVGNRSSTSKKNRVWEEYDTSDL
jgi:hypothetical protein